MLPITPIALCFLVAGPRVALGIAGYEPAEMLLLHPAIVWTPESESHRRRLGCNQLPELLGHLVLISLFVRPFSMTISAYNVAFGKFLFDSGHRTVA